FTAASQTLEAGR
nr:RecName: Full=Uncharacterized protein IMPP9 [Nautilus macromphalus]